MTDKRLEQAYQDACHRWYEAHPLDAVLTTQARYFFWAGAELDIEATSRIYDQIVGKNLLRMTLEDVDEAS